MLPSSPTACTSDGPYAFSQRASTLFSRTPARAALKRRVACELARKEPSLRFPLQVFRLRIPSQAAARNRIKEIIDSGELGQVKNIGSTLALPRGFMPGGDIWLQFDLNGGSFTPCYPLDVESLSIESPAPRHPSPATIDRGSHAVLTFPNSVAAEISCDYRPTFTVTLESGYLDEQFRHAVAVSLHPRYYESQGRQDADVGLAFPKPVAGGGGLRDEV
ncbi:hypothetical protein BOTBODRAFT_186850 [Botryobasidium botryosum FD-172 SS1]|uniref:Uncharacterized protein n=1 Tax=Botryobasidium botryosum (strain FD-172 SS1) TaxID=930990 RepID=A0A067MW47_BOTB1|nr:hypothetical protein BOTBODRAFT_186850 [Botryobasidium botryosum FD-172 SS1]